MTYSFRSVLLVAATLSASQVAPAQVHSDAEPLIANGSSVLPANVVLQQIPETNSLADDRLSPLPAVVTQPAPAPVVEQEEEAVTVDASASLADKVAALRSANPGNRELECLATGIYFESKSEPLAGQLAVGQVIANRANSGGRFPASYCGVLFQRGQFSFVRGHRLPAVSHSNRQWQTAVAIAKIVDQDLHESPVGNALFFHARYVSPGWRLKRVASIGNHVFYR